MRINCVNNISFQKLPMRKDKGRNIIDDFVYRAQDSNRTMYTVSHNQFIHDSYDIKFQNDDEFVPAASQQINIYPETILVDSMYTNPEFQYKYGFGKSMHLINIIEMLENNAALIELEAVSEAIPFHTSMGYYPNGKWRNGLSKNIKSISNDNTAELSKYAEIAKLLLKSCNMSEIALSILGNNLLNQYTKAALEIKPKRDLKYLFSRSTNMTLKRKDVLKNKDFYNNLYDKYEIDYHID